MFFVNDALGQMVPIIIGFLASLVNLGGIGQKIRSNVETLQKPVNKALDFVIKTGLKLAGPIIRGVKGISGKVKAKVAAGKAWVKGKADSGKTWVKGKVAGIGTNLGRPSGPAAGRDGGDVRRRAGDLVIDRLHGTHTEDEIKSVVTGVRGELQPMGLKQLDFVPGRTPGQFDVVAQRAAMK